MTHYISFLLPSSFFHKDNDSDNDYDGQLTICVSNIKFSSFCSLFCIFIFLRTQLMLYTHTLIRKLNLYHIKFKFTFTFTFIRTIFNYICGMHFDLYSVEESITKKFVE